MWSIYFFLFTNWSLYSRKSLDVIPQLAVNSWHVVWDGLDMCPLFLVCQELTTNWKDVEHMNRIWENPYKNDVKILMGEHLKKKKNKELES
jgi:hypothetical protein